MKHGDAQRSSEYFRLYALWSGIKRRCYNQNDHCYQTYGAKGIGMCDEWRDDYTAFRDWALVNGYDLYAQRGECTIDRIDNTKDYCPENCHFITTAEQNDNKSNVIHVEYNGEIKNLAEWSKVVGVKYTTLVNRFHKGYRGSDLFNPCHYSTRPNIIKENVI